MTHVDFLGHLLSHKGIAISKQKVAAINATRAPRDVAKTRSFLGLASFCAKYIPNFATLAEPLREVTRRGVGWYWGAAQQRALENLKTTLGQSATLAFFSKEAAKKLFVDASPVGLGAVLVQEQKSGSVRPVAYASRTLSSVERRYSQTEKEALAVVWGCERFSLYLLGVEFQLITDHKALEAIYSTRSKPSARIERWVLRLQPYRFKIVYRRGSENIADALSRLLPEGEGKRVIGESELHVRFIASNAVPHAMPLEEIQQASESDSAITAITRALNNDTPFPKTLVQLEKLRLELTAHQGLILRQNRIFIPQTLRRKVINIAHAGHQGVIRTKQRLRTKVWWPGMENDVKFYIKHCAACQYNGATEKPEMICSTDLPDGPWRDLALDICGPFPGGESLLVLVDFYSRWPEAKIVRTTTTTVVISWLRDLFSRWGYPENLTTDNGSQFTSSEFSNFMRECGINHRRVTPYWPQANGTVERLNRSFLKSFRAQRVNGLDWRTSLLDFLQAYRSTPHCTTGVSPYELMTGRLMKDKLPQLLGVTKSPLHTHVRGLDKARKLRSKSYADKRRRSRDSLIQVDDWVLLSTPKRTKLDVSYEKELKRVVRKTGNCLTLRCADGRIIKRNVSQCKRFYSEDDSPLLPVSHSTPARKGSSTEPDLKAESKVKSHSPRPPSLSAALPAPAVLPAAKEARERRPPARYGDFVMACS